MTHNAIYCLKSRQGSQTVFLMDSAKQEVQKRTLKVTKLSDSSQRISYQQGWSFLGLTVQLFSF